METRKRLQNNRDALLDEYHSNFADVCALQDILIQEILPSVTDELELDSEMREWVKQWLSDTSSIFRISRRNKFTRSFSLEAIQKNLQWRLDNLWPVEPPLMIPNLYFLPGNIRDPFGRPILVVEVAPVDASPDSQKRLVIHAFEWLRVLLQKLYEIPQDDGNACPPLQYVILLDLSQLSLQSLNIDLFTWTLREVLPRFPGMLAGVFMLNYSWTHAGLWNVVKHLLPESALSRIFFPSRKELIEYFTLSCLPQEYGGTLPSLAHFANAVRPQSSELSAVATLKSPITQQPTSSEAPPSWLSSTSILNPFFGYPVSASSTRTFRHGRRRKRDLARTLATLFWLRWRNHITVGISLTVTLLIGVCIRKGILRLPRTSSISRLLLSSRH